MRARREITDDERHGLRSAGLSSEIKGMVTVEHKGEERRVARWRWYARGEV